MHRITILWPPVPSIKEHHYTVANYGSTKPSQFPPTREDDQWSFEKLYLQYSMPIHDGSWLKPSSDAQPMLSLYCMPQAWPLRAKSTQILFTT